MKKNCVIVFAFLFLLSELIVNVSAINSSFPITKTNENDAFSKFNSLNLSVFEEEPELYKKFSHIAIRNDHGFAVSSYERPNREIYVFDCDGNFEYGFSLYYDGEFYIEFDNENLLIINYYSNGIILSIDKNGSLVDYAQIDNSSNNDEIQKEVFSSTKTLDDYTYTLKNNGFLSELSSSYKKVVRIDKNGDRLVILDITNNVSKSDTNPSNKPDVSPMFYIFGVPIVLIGSAFIIFLTILQIKRRQGTVLHTKTENDSVSSSETPE